MELWEKKEWTYRYREKSQIQETRGKRKEKAELYGSIGLFYNENGNKTKPSEVVEDNNAKRDIADKFASICLSLSKSLMWYEKSSFLVYYWV